MIFYNCIFYPLEFVLHVDISLDLLEKSKSVSVAVVNLHIQILYVRTLQLLNIVSIHRSISNCFFFGHLQIHNIPKSQCEVLWSGTVDEQVITTCGARVTVAWLRVCHVTQINL